MVDNKLYSGNKWHCPFCDYSNHIEDDLGVHMIANHDKQLYEAGVYGTNKLGSDEKLKITAKLEPQGDGGDNDE